MVSRSTKSFIVVILLVILVQAFGAYSLRISEHVSRPCNGSIAECNKDDEMLMDSEVSESLIRVTKRLSYRALAPDKAAAGAAKSGNPYTRPCLAIKRCRYKR